MKASAVIGVEYYLWFGTGLMIIFFSISYVSETSNANLIIGIVMLAVGIVPLYAIFIVISECGLRSTDSY